jgi:hypothetical protein
MARLGSDRFDREDYAVPYFVEAAQGKDAAHGHRALQTRGRTSRRPLELSTDVPPLDRLIREPRRHREEDGLRDEAEEYRSTARTPGGERLPRLLEPGQRDYESRVPLSLGHLMRSHDFEEAIDCDKPGSNATPPTPKRWRSPADGGHPPELEQT